MESDYIKERITFFTKILLALFGMLVLDISGIIGLYKTSHIDFIFWLGIFIAIILVFVCIFIFINVYLQINKLKEI